MFDPLQHGVYDDETGCTANTTTITKTKKKKENKKKKVMIISQLEYAGETKRKASSKTGNKPVFYLQCTTIGPASVGL